MTEEHELLKERDELVTEIRAKIGSMDMDDIRTTTDLLANINKEIDRRLKAYDNMRKDLKKTHKITLVDVAKWGLTSEELIKIEKLFNRGDKR